MQNRRRTCDYVPIQDCYLLKAYRTLLYRSVVEITVEKRHNENPDLVLLERLQSVSWSNTKRLSPFSLIEMASHGSTSDSGPSVEAKIDSLETSLGRLRAHLERQDKLLQEANQAGEKAWDLINEDIRKLRADHAASTENLENFEEESHTNFKDVANVHGDFGNRISTLESTIANLKAKMGK